MIWIKLRSIAAVTLALGIGIATGAAGVAVRGAQDPAAPVGLPAPQPKATAPPEDAGSKKLLRALQLATRKARIVADMARLARELAELAIVEYEEVAYPQSLEEATGKITLAQADLDRARDQVTRSKAMLEQAKVSKDTAFADELLFAKAGFELEEAETQLDVLTKYTRGKTLKTLRDDVERARAAELSREADWVRERGREVEVQRPLHPDPK